jgi:hypothetical protein
MMVVAMTAVTGCRKGSTDIESENFAISSSAHTITLTLDSPVEACWITDEGLYTTTEGQVNAQTNSIDCKGDWYSATVDMKSPKEIILTVDANDTGEKRELTIIAYHMGKLGSMSISQKAK